MKGRADNGSPFFRLYNLVILIHMLPTITSRQNPLCKIVRALHSSKGRREHKLFVAEGQNAVEAAIENRWPIQKLFCAETGVLQYKEMNLNFEIQTAAPEILEYLSDAQTNPGVLALCELPPSKADFDFANLLLILDGIGDPGNVGTLIRSADAAGAGGVLCAQNSADPFSPKAVRSSAGSVFHAPPIGLQNNSPSEIIALLQEQSTPIVIASGDGDISCFEYSWPQKCALVLGHETRGVSEEFHLAATAKIKIPIYGKAESLNVASAGTVLLYAWQNFQESKIK